MDRNAADRNKRVLLIWDFPALGGEYMILEDIIISRVRVKILTLFLSHPGTIFHVRDIVRKVDEEINAVRRELAHMEDAGMVSKEQRANRLFYSFRKDYPLYNELLDLMGKTSGFGADVLKHKAKLGKLKFVMVSGRYLRGLQKKSQTDVDVLVVGRDPFVLGVLGGSRVMIVGDEEDLVN